MFVSSKRGELGGRAALCALLCTVGLVAAAPAAAAGWSPVHDLTSREKTAYEPQVAGDGAGDAIAIWDRYESPGQVIEVAERKAGGAWSSPEKLTQPADGEANHPQIAVNAAGDAVAAWQLGEVDFDRVVQVATRPAGGSWSAPQTLPTVLGIEPQVGIDAAGDAVVTWMENPGYEWVIDTATHPAGGPWSAATALSTPGGSATEPQVAVNAAGDAVVTWQRLDSGNHPIAEAANRPAGGEWSGPQAISPAAQQASAPQVAIDAEGGAVAAWIQYDGMPVIDVATLSLAGSWSAPELVSAPTVAAQSLDVSLDPAGDAIVAWDNAAGSQAIEVTERSAGGGPWSAPEAISASEGEGFLSPQFPKLAQDENGDAVAVWPQYEIAASNYVTLTATRPAGGAWSAPEPLSEPELESFGQQVTMSPRGDVTLVWSGTIYGEASFPMPPMVKGAVIQAVSRSADLLAVDTEGEGVGAVKSEPAGIDCGPTCWRWFQEGTVVHLTPEPAAGFEFAGWSGACEGSGACAVTVSGAVEVTAKFRAKQATPSQPTTPTSSVACPGSGVLAADAVPRIQRSGPQVAGVRARLSVNQPSWLEVVPLLVYRDHGSRRQVQLPTRTLHATGDRTLRLALPEAARRALPLGARARLVLQVWATPDSQGGCAASKARSDMHVQVRVVKVLRAQQAGVR